MEQRSGDWDWLDYAVGGLSADFLSEGREQPEAQVRPELDELFG